MRYQGITRVALLAIAMAAGMKGWAQQSASGESEPPQQPGGSNTDSSKHQSFPVDLAGYVSFRYIEGDALNEDVFIKEYSASIFASKTIGRWRFHSEFNVGNSPEFEGDGIRLVSFRSDSGVKVDTASLNYNLRDWLQIEGGFLFVPTYWREHRYQSTTLTADDPLIDQTIFSSALKGAAVHGDKYFEHGGFTYEIYGGVDQQTQLANDVQTSTIERSRAIGGKVVLHLPSHHFFNTLDAGFQRLHRGATTGSLPDDIYGLEMHVEKGRMGLLAEFAHASIDVANGRRDHIRQGYYVQPSYQITKKLFAVARYDRLNRDSRFAIENKLGTEIVGLVYRPIPAVSLKFDMNRIEPQVGRLPAYYGPTVGVVYFFHRP